ncbi:MAG: glycosyltransferase family 4 protein, partial [Streptosporangiaceae bacterium]
MVNGYTSPWMAMAMAICRSRGIPYLLRASSHPDGMSTGARRQVRRAVTKAVVSASSGGLSMGYLNDQFYRQRHARRIIFAPNSVDDRRFAAPPTVGRENLMAQWELKNDKPLVMYCGKLYAGKRPFDIISALKLLPREVNILFVGDGILASQVRDCIPPGTGAVTGFINQSQLPAYYHAADVLVLPSQTETWGLVINVGMAAGALPVVSDQVG